MKALKYLLALVTLGALATVPGWATAITGEANISGTATVNNTGIYFNATGTNVTNTYNVESPNTGDFTGLTGGTIGNILGPPTSGPDNIPGFATFNVAEGVITFDLQTLNPGVGNPADCLNNNIGNVCTPLLGNGKLSPFTLIQVATNQVTISLSLEGIAHLNNTNGVSKAPFVFTNQNTVPGTITGILMEAGTQKGITNSYSATISASTSVPEPATAACFIMGFGLLGAGLLARRKKNC